MSRIVLIHCHRDPFVIANRLRLMRAMGDDRVQLLFGGRERLFPVFMRMVRALSGMDVEGYCLRDRTPLWKWAHTDLAVLDWFRDSGVRQSFTSVAVLQWDIVMYVPVDTAYADVPADAVGLSGLVPLAEMEADWPWLKHHEPYRQEWLRLQEWMHDHHGFDGPHHLCIGPGYVLPRSFLEKYAATDIPDLCHDELRLPTFGKGLGFDVCDTRFYRSWTDADEQEVFNPDRRPISMARLRQELADPAGRRVFHPVRTVTPTGGLGAGDGDVRFGRHDQVMRACSGALSACLQPPRRIRSYWNRFAGKYLGRRAWPYVPREHRAGSWHE